MKHSHCVWHLAQMVMFEIFLFYKLYYVYIIWVGSTYPWLTPAPFIEASDFSAQTSQYVFFTLTSPTAFPPDYSTVYGSVPLPSY